MQIVKHPSSGMGGSGCLGLGPRASWWSGRVSRNWRSALGRLAAAHTQTHRNSQARHMADGRTIPAGVDR
eukprot:666368-Prymnesium_polylepis.2